MMTPKYLFALLFQSLLFVCCSAVEYPDVGGILDFSKPDEISERVFILTNPKSGSHLLLYSLMKITQRPLRGRVAYWYFENDPPFFVPENMMGYPLDFSKPTIYWGHEYYLLEKLNHGCNKLIFISRNYKEVLLSNTVLQYHCNPKDDPSKLSSYLLDEVVNEGMIFKEFLIRLSLFDTWNPAYRHLVAFEDLVSHPQNFVPQTLAFIGDDSEYLEFIDNYAEFKLKLMEKYRGKPSNATGSGESLRYFSNFVPMEILREVDDHVHQRYPHLWIRYLSQFAES